MNKNKSIITFFVLLFAIICIFILDLILPLGMALGFVYILIIFVSSRLNPKHTIFLTVVSSIAVAIDLFVGHGEIDTFIIFNRFFAIVLIWLMSMLFVKLKTTEMRLKKSELHYRSIVEGTKEGILITNKQGKIKFANQMTTSLFGYSIEELMTINVKDLLKLEEAKLNTVTDTGYELNLKQKNGSEIIINVNLIPFGTEESDNLIVIRDITSGKKTEEALTESQARLAGIVASAMDAIITIDKEQKIVLFNNAAEKMFEYSKEEIIGKHLDFLIPTELREIHRQHIISFGKTGVTNRHMGALGSVKGMKKNGQEFPIEASISQIESSGHKFYTVILRDVTERKLAEQHLLESENRFRNMADNAPVLIWISNDRMDLTYFNKTLLDFTGRTLEQERNMGWTSLIHPDDRDAIIKIFINYFESREAFNLEFRLLRKDGEFRWILNQGIPRFTNEGQFIGYIGSAVDITERKIFEEQLNASLKEKEILLKEVHHRVKNNLQIISSLLNLQSEHIKDDRMINLLVESQNRIKSMALIHEKLYQTKALAKINLQEYISELTGNLFSSYLANPDTVKLKTDIENIQLDIDAGIDLGLIVNELISNSLKYAFPEDFKGDKIIYLSLRKVAETGKMKLTVKDSGVGVPPDFDIRKSDSLGLQLVETLALQLEGKFEYHVNNGTTFNIIF